MRRPKKTISIFKIESNIRVRRSETYDASHTAIELKRLKLDRLHEISDLRNARMRLTVRSKHAIDTKIGIVYKLTKVSPVQEHIF